MKPKRKVYIFAEDVARSAVDMVGSKLSAESALKGDGDVRSIQIQLDGSGPE